MSSALCTSHRPPSPTTPREPSSPYTPHCSSPSATSARSSPPSRPLPRLPPRTPASQDPPSSSQTHNAAFAGAVVAVNHLIQRIPAPAPLHLHRRRTQRQCPRPGGIHRTRHRMLSSERHRIRRRRLGRRHRVALSPLITPSLIHISGPRPTQLWRCHPDRMIRPRQPVEHLRSRVRTSRPPQPDGPPVRSSPYSSTSSQIPPSMPSDRPSRSPAQDCPSP